MNRAVIVGIDSYPNAPLNGCANDAMEIATCLSLEQYDFDSKILMNAQASLPAVQEVLSEIAHTEEGDNLLFYFAGHGQVLGNTGYLVTHDAKPYLPGISLGQLAQIMEAASENFQHVVTILDCCHSGGAFNWPNSRILQTADIDREIIAVNESRCILAACRPEQLAYEDPHQQKGVFTTHLVDALLDNAVDWNGNVTLLGVYEWIATAMGTDTQTPVFKGDFAGNVILGSGFEPREGRPLEQAELSKTLGKAHQLVDKYHYLQLQELSERTNRLSQGARKCSLELENIVNWFDETSKALPDLRRDQNWKELTSRLRENRKNLADISIGENTRFGRVMRHLGHGGYGHVWEIKNDQGETYALKVFHGNELDDDVKVRRFANGYQNMKKLDHPRIVQVREIISSPFGFVMDAIPGDNLRNFYIDRNDQEGVMQIIIDICDTVQFAHSQQVKHRDIKPENIIVVYGDEGRAEPYLTDFDLAYHETNRTITTNLGVGGVINYAAPEQLYEPNTKAARSETVDVFSLAQLMYFIIVGKDPSGEKFQRNTQSLKKVVESWVDDRAAIVLLDLYRKATDKSPDNRPQSVTEFSSLLRDAKSIIQIASNTDKIAEKDICRKIGHGYVGLSRYEATEDKCSMHSPSGQVEVIVRITSYSGKENINFEAELSVTGNIPIPSFSSGTAARRSINSRLDKIFRDTPNVQRHPGSKGAYQVFLEIKDIPLDVSGVQSVVKILNQAVARIEQW